MVYTELCICGGNGIPQCDIEENLCDFHANNQVCANAMQRSYIRSNLCIPTEPSVLLPPYGNYLTASQLETYDNSAQWSIFSSQGTLSQDTVRFSQGTGALKLSTSAGSNTVTAFKAVTGPNMTLSTYDNMQFDVWVNESIGGGRTIRIGFFTTSGLTRGILGTRTIPANFVGWIRFNLHKTGSTLTGSDWTGTGGGQLTDTFTHMVAQFVGSANGQSISVDNLQYNFDMAKYVLIGAHDEHVRQYTIGFQELEARGLRHNIIPDMARVGLAGRLTHAQIREMIAAGHPIVNHFYNHNNPAAFTQQQVEDELNLAEAAMVSNSIVPPTSFVSPNGGWSDLVDAGATAQGYVVGHGAHTSFLYLPNPKVLRVPARTIDNQSLAQVTAALDTINTQGGGQVLYYHDINTAGDATTVSTATFTGVLDYLVDNEIVPITFAQLYQLHQGSEVSVYAPWGS